MRITPTGPSSASHVSTASVYRVNIWDRAVPGSGRMLTAFILEDPEDVVEVLDWARETAADRDFEVFLELDAIRQESARDARDAALVRIFGSDPNVS